MRRVTYLSFAVLLAVMGCAKTPAPGPSDTNADATTTDSHVPTPGESASRVIPDDVTYTIIEENVVPEMKRSLDIRLNRKVSEDILRAIAIEVRGSDPKRYDRTFIGYYLPDMQVNAGCWATTHFTPDLEVRILGMTADQEVVLASEAVHASHEIIGRWLDERPFGRGRIVIYEKDGKLFLENTYKDGSAGTDAIVESPSSHGRRFDYNPDRGNGEYFLINAKGELQQLDKDGVFMTAKQLD